MNKNIVLAVLAAIFVMCTSVFAQTTELPAIDEKAAEAYLGTWYMDQMCGDGSCFSASDFGLTGTMELNADNTLILTIGDQAPENANWYMEDGAAYMVHESEEGRETTKLEINEDGNLFMGGEKEQLTFKREAPIQWGSAEVKADAVYEDFEGEWYLNSMVAEGVFIPATLFGLEGKLVIREDTLDFEMTGQDGDEYKNVAYELKDGAINASVVSGEKTEKILVEYHEDNSVIISFSGDEGNIMSLVFIRQENLSEGGLNLIDLLSSAIDAAAAEGSETAAEETAETTTGAE